MNSTYGFSYAKTSIMFNT